jgi:hypothetical protein
MKLESKNLEEKARLGEKVLGSIILKLFFKKLIYGHFACM